MKTATAILFTALFTHSCGVTSHISAIRMSEKPPAKAREKNTSPQTKDPGLLFYGDFRNAFWGQSRVEVKEKEIWEVVNQEPDRLTFKGELWGLQAFSHYTFSTADDVLIGASYRIEEDSLSKNEGKKIGEKVAQILKRKYGKADPDIFFSETEVGGIRYPLYRIMGWENGKISSSIIVEDKTYKLTIDIKYQP